MGLILTTSGNFAFMNLFGLSRAEDDYGPFTMDLSTTLPGGSRDTLADFSIASFPGYSQINWFPFGGINPNMGAGQQEQDWSPGFWQLVGDLGSPLAIACYVVADSGGNVLFYSPAAGNLGVLQFDGDFVYVTIQLICQWGYP